MAPSLTSNSSSTTSNPVASDWTDFINIIGTSVVPIITLFGEQTTKQFLSLSMGWADDIILAATPIGIITIVVSAIRVTGYRWLKAILGRARESAVTVEQEFLSSTSQEVCELWSGREIVRAIGNPEETNNMKTLVISVKRSSGTGTDVPTAMFASLEDAASAYKGGNLFQNLYSGTDRPADEFASETPNLTLNVPDVLLSDKKLWCLTFILALPIQLFTLILPALVTYYWKLPRKGVPVTKFAYACFAAGTIAIFSGLLFCGRAIENSTTEQVFRPTKGKKAQVQRIICLQMACTVGSQHFSSFAILYNPNNRLFRTSCLDKEKSNTYSFQTAVASLFSVAGFIAQFIGLGALHWSATLTVLFASLIMTGMRAWARKGLAKHPVCVPIPEKTELVWVALRAFRNDWQTSEGENKPNRGYGILARFRTPQPKRIRYVGRQRDSEWCIPTGFIAPISSDGTSICYPKPEGMPDTNKQRYNKASTEYVRQLTQFASRSQGRVIEFRVGFRSIASAPLPQECSQVKAVSDLILAAPHIPSIWDCAEAASNLADTMEGILTIFYDFGLDPIAFRKTSSWAIDVQQTFGLKTTWVVHLDPDGLRRDLIAGLSMWVYSLACGSDSLDTGLRNVDPLFWRNRPQTFKLTPGEAEYFIRILGNSRYMSSTKWDIWMRRILGAEGHSDIYQEIPAYNGEWDEGDSRHGEFQLRILRSWPVFGLYSSATFEPDSSKTPSHEAPIGLALPSVDDYTKEWETPADERRDVILRDYPENTIEVECALEILSLFILSLCQRDASRSMITLLNNEEKTDLLIKLAQEIVSAKLAGSIKNALMYIVPAFARFDLMEGLNS